jgi:apolipoprotein D and lipocalin family protein
MSKQNLFVTLFAFLAACSTGDLDKKYGALKLVDKVNLNRFMGRWYVIANIPTFIEKGACNATETYTWNEEKQRIDIDFKFNKDSINGEQKSYSQKGFIFDKENNSEWRIQPFWPLKFSYLILDLDKKDYSYTVIGVPNRGHVWIMARTPKLDKLLYSDIVRNIAKMGFDISQLKLVPQGAE